MISQNWETEIVPSPESAQKTVRVDHFATVHSSFKIDDPQLQAHKSIGEKQIANKAQRHLEFICKLI